MFTKKVGIIFSAFAIAYCFTLVGCANIIPPSGGARDSLPPVLIMALPKDSATNVATNKFTLTFSEFVEVKDVQQNLVVNPLPNNMPEVDYKLRNVLIKWKDSLQANTTYTINFGNSIKDVNEGNPAKNFTYIFSTGKQIDEGSLKGTITIAKDGSIDSSLIVVLHPNLSDTAITKLKPKYMSKLNGIGEYQFTNLANGNYNVYALSSSFTKTYQDTTELFAFYNSPISISKDSIKTLNLLAFIQTEKEAKPLITESKAEKKITYSPNLFNGKLDVLDSSFKIVFNKKISVDSSLKLTDTNNVTIANYTKLVEGNTLAIGHKFLFGGVYKLILPKQSIKDSLGTTLPKTDTIIINCMHQKDYGKVKLRLALNPSIRNPLLLMYKDGSLHKSVPIFTKEVSFTYLMPAEYSLFVVEDVNKNGKWDSGNYFKKLQPEKTIPIKKKLPVKANWDNEMEISL